MVSFLAAADVGAILGDAGMTIVIGFVVVFAVLLLLTGIFKLFGVVMSKSEKRAKEPVVAPAPVAPAPVAAAPAAAPAPAAAAPVDLGPVMSTAQVRNGIRPEETAVIAAAVAAAMPAGQKYTISKIDFAE